MSLREKMHRRKDEVWEKYALRIKQLMKDETIGHIKMLLQMRKSNENTAFMRKNQLIDALLRTLKKDYFDESVNSQDEPGVSLSGSSSKSNPKKRRHEERDDAEQSNLAQNAMMESLQKTTKRKLPAFMQEREREAS